MVRELAKETAELPPELRQEVFSAVGNVFGLFGSEAARQLMPMSPNTVSVTVTKF